MQPDVQTARGSFANVNQRGLHVWQGKVEDSYLLPGGLDSILNRPASFHKASGQCSKVPEITVRWPMPAHRHQRSTPITTPDWTIKE